MNHRTAMIVHPIELSAHELGTLAICTTRYCLQSNSAFSSSIRTLLERLLPVLTPGDCASIESEIYRALHREEQNWDAETYDSWRKLLKIFAAK